MVIKSKIEWTETTWNPITGCTKISNGCENCYAERIAKRLHAMGQPRYRNCFDLTIHKDLIEEPLFWKKPRMVFVNSMSDLFHNKVPLNIIEDIFFVIQKAKQHTFQILTKRADRLEKVAPKLIWPQNLWMGVTVESDKYINRIEKLKKVNASIKFVSFEPLLGPINSNVFPGLDWVIVGGESGPRSRSPKAEWIRNIRDECQNIGIPFFFKQWGGFNKRKTGRVLDGSVWSEYPRLLEILDNTA